MPIHDWTRVKAGTFHAFHTFWIAEIAKTLNAGVLPEGYFALPEQVVESLIPDVVTLRDHDPGNGATGNVALAVAPPVARQRCRPASPTRRRAPARQVAVRRASDHQVVAVIEVVPPANKDRRDRVLELALKAETLLRSGVHLLLLDVLPPGRHDPRGSHAAVWARFDRRRYRPPDGEPLTLASYRWDDGAREPEAFIEPTAVGRALAAMPLFLTAGRYVTAPVEATYGAAFAALPAVYRTVLEAPA